jgi:anti-anti-sigma factor
MGKLKITEVTLTGRFDAANHAEQINQLIRPLSDRPKFLLLNLEGLESLDSKGLSSIITVHRQVKAWEGEMAILCPPGPVNELFNLTNVSRLVRLFNSRTEVELTIDP